MPDIKSCYEYTSFESTLKHLPFTQRNDRLKKCLQHKNRNRLKRNQWCLIGKKWHYKTLHPRAGLQWHAARFSWGQEVLPNMQLLSHAPRAACEPCSSSSALRLHVLNHKTTHTGAFQNPTVKRISNDTYGLCAIRIVI